MADFGGGDLEAFRAEARAWLATNYPAEFRNPDVKTDPEAVWGGRAFANNRVDPHCVWVRALAGRGWTAPTWPKNYGGGGLSQAEAHVLDEELARGGYRTALLSQGL